MWDYTRYALQFFKSHLPYREMQSLDRLVDDPDAYCFAKPGEIYAIYLPLQGDCKLDLTGIEGQFSIRWYNPRRGGAMLTSELDQVEGGHVASLGTPPTESGQDWVVLVKKTE
jgi:hypothetical protein